jgi:hypothetical protein
MQTALYIFILVVALVVTNFITARITWYYGVKFGTQWEIDRRKRDRIINKKVAKRIQ